MNFKWTPARAILAVLALWAAVYLPGLGACEIRGEEGRRIMPAITMLEGGNWIVPQVSGQTYFNKPPGLNWLIAASMVVTGRRDELAARLPSVLAILAVALAMVAMPNKTLGLRARLLSALVFLTGVGVLEKGRLIEIEAAYLAFAGLALAWWLWRYPDKPRALSTWVPPALLMAGGTLVKAPFLAAGFYPVVIAVLAYRRRLKDLFCPAHLLGIALILLIDGAWVVLAIHQQNTSNMGVQWEAQLSSRFLPREFHLGQWAMQVVLSLHEFAPYILAAPLLWTGHVRAGMDDHTLATFKGLRAGCVIGFLLLAGMPGGLSRYVLPVWPAVALAIGWALERHTQMLATDRIWKALLPAGAFALAVVAGGAMAVEGVGFATLAVAAVAAGLAFATLQWRGRLSGGFALAFATACLVGLAAIEFNVLGEPFRLAGEHRRQAGAAVSELVPAGQTLCVYRPGLKAFSLARPESDNGHLDWLYYVRAPIKYLLQPENIDQTARYLLVSRSHLEQDDLAWRIGQLGGKLIEDPRGRVPEDYCIYRFERGETGPPDASSRGNG